MQVQVQVQLLHLQTENLSVLLAPCQVPVLVHRVQHLQWFQFLHLPGLTNSLQCSFDVVVQVEASIAAFKLWRVLRPLSVEFFLVLGAIRLAEVVKMHHAANAIEDQVARENAKGHLISYQTEQEGKISARPVLQVHLVPVELQVFGRVAHHLVLWQLFRFD